MESKKSTLFILFLILFTGSLWAQKTISGRVFDNEGNTLPGASIVIPGTTTGVTTDIDGNFSLDVPVDQNVVEVSFIGFVPKRVSIEGVEFVEVTLMPTIEQLQEVVVTALGIKREAKALGYSVQQVEGDALSNASRINPLSGLAGQVAGLQIGESGSGAGGSARILIRGANSLTGNNEPLFVIDGVPIDNSGGSSGGLFGGFDYGNAINNINLDDVESISVLKGGAASALYGARGQNGVIMITTRGGTKKDGIGITYQAMVSSATPLIKPDFQNQFAQGSGGNFVQLGANSWGPVMNGQQVTNFLGQSVTLNPTSEHPYDGFFRNSTSIDQSLTLDKRTETTGVLFSAAWNLNNGMIQTNEIDKKSFNLRYDTQLAEYLTLDARANYLSQEANNRPTLGGSPDNPVYIFTNMPVSVTLDQLNPFQTVSGNAIVWNSLYSVNENGTISNVGSPAYATSPLMQNPYWATELNTNRDKRSRLLGFASLRLDIRKMMNLNFDLDLTVKAGIDQYNDERERIVANKTYYKLDGLATGNWNRLEITEGNYDFLLNAGQTWNSFTLRGSVGGNIMQYRFRGLSSSSESGLINPVGPYVIQNFNNPQTGNGISDRRIHSLYGMLSMDYRRMVFMDVTFRNDWTSVLSPENWSYQYPSVSASWLLEETFELPQSIDMFKLRASWAGVGSGGSIAGQRYFQYGTSPTQYRGLPYGFFNSDRPEPNLRSEYTISQEAGFELIMFGSRLRTDLAIYQTGTRDQIFRNPLAPSSGFAGGYINSGFVNNTGVELFTSYRIIDNDNFSWNASVNVTRQWSKVEEISDDIDRIIQAAVLGDSGVRIAAMLGQPAGVILGTAFARDDQGRLLLTEENLPQRAMNESGAFDIDRVIGNATPDYLWGFNSNFSIRNFQFGFQIDSKLGHEIFSVTNMVGAERGTLGFTAMGREDWYRAIELASVDPALSPGDFNLGHKVTGVRPGETEERDFYVDPQKYWEAASRIHESFVYNASFIRFRQLSAGYSLRGSLLRNTPFQEISLSVFASNLFYFMINTENISPESSFGTGNNSGFELYGYPEMRTLGVNLKVSL